MLGASSGRQPGDLRCMKKALIRQGRTGRAARVRERVQDAFFWLGGGGYCHGVPCGGEAAMRSQNGVGGPAGRVGRGPARRGRRALQKLSCCEARENRRGWVGNREGGGGGWRLMKYAKRPGWKGLARRGAGREYGKSGCKGAQSSRPREMGKRNQRGGGAGGGRRVPETHNQNSE